jgi:hypothetical protein
MGNLDWASLLHLGYRFRTWKVSRHVHQKGLPTHQTTRTWFMGTDADVWFWYSVIPSMGDFLSIMSAAFDSFFGFIFWAVAYYHMNKNSLWSTPLKSALTVINVIIFVLGLFMLGPGLYTSVQAIIDD